MQTWGCSPKFSGLLLLLINERMNMQTIVKYDSAVKIYGSQWYVKIWMNRSSILFCGFFFVSFEANSNLQKSYKYSPNAFFFWTHFRISCQSDTSLPLNTLGMFSTYKGFLLYNHNTTIKIGNLHQYLT